MEVPAPARPTCLVAPVGHVRGCRIEPRAGSLSHDVNHDGGVDEPADAIPNPNASVLDHDVNVADVVSVGGQEAAEPRQQGTKLLVHSVRVQSIRDDELHLRPLCRIQGRDLASVIAVQPLARWRVRQVVVPARRRRSNVQASRGRVLDHALVEPSVQCTARVRVDGLKSPVGLRRIDAAQIKAALAQRVQPSAPFVLERWRGAPVAAGLGVCGIEGRGRVCVPTPAAAALMGA